MAFTHGKNTIFKIDDSGNTLQDISAYVTNVDFPQPIDTVETTTFGNSSKTYIPGLKDANISIEGEWDPTVDGYLAGIVGGDAGDFEYGPEGSTAGDIKYSGSCICTGYNVKSSISGEVKFSATFQVTGDVTRGTYV